MKATACGKLILFGEHAVVYGQPAIAVPLKNTRLSVQCKPAKKDQVRFSVKAADRKKLMAALAVAKKECGVDRNFNVTIKSNLPIRCGLGSSAALSIALARAFSKGITPAASAKVGLEIEKVFHGSPSGIDTTVSANEKAIIFTKGKKPRFIKIKPMWVLIANTGKRESTKKVVADVRKRLDKNHSLWLTIGNIGAISKSAAKALRKGDVQKLGNLMNLNQTYLRWLGVSSRKLDRCIIRAKKNGALGAKLTGSGKGGCMIALFENRKKAMQVAKKIPNSFATRIS